MIKAQNLLVRRFGSSAVSEIQARKEGDTHKKPGGSPISWGAIPE